MLTALLFAFSALAFDHKFICHPSSGDAPLIVADTTLVFQGVTYINKSPVSYTAEYRDYSNMGDPWMTLTINNKMLTEGVEGYADLLVANTHTGVETEQTMSCTPEL